MKLHGKKAIKFYADISYLSAAGQRNFQLGEYKIDNGTIHFSVTYSIRIAWIQALFYGF
jgi:hypothetical protein